MESKCEFTLLRVALGNLLRLREVLGLSVLRLLFLAPPALAQSPLSKLNAFFSSGDVTQSIDLPRTRGQDMLLTRKRPACASED
jgi:hypothetical protein